jgi:hypothetical protein
VAPACPYTPMPTTSSARRCGRRPPAHVVAAQAHPGRRRARRRIADAAAVLRWAGVRRPHLAASTRADVPFCLLGGRARVTGIGDELAPLPLVDATCTLLTPPFGVSTPAVYRAWDELGGRTPRAQRPGAGRAAGRAELGRWRGSLGDATGAHRCWPGAARRGSSRGTTRARPGWWLLLGPALEAGALEHLLVLLLAHALCGAS